LIVKFNLFSSRNRSPNEKSRKINPFAASDERGVRSQKLIKHHNYTRLAVVLQRRKSHIERCGEVQASGLVAIAPARWGLGCNLAGVQAGYVLSLIGGDLDLPRNCR
jgi:hypothetical protein